MTPDLLTHITSQFTGGDRAVGEPVYRKDGVVAYSPQQAQIIFKNLLDARIQDKPIPFLISNTGWCVIRRDVMMQHMMYHQKIEPEAIGSALALLNSPDSRNLADYRKRLARAIEKMDHPDPPLIEGYNKGFVSSGFDMHTAATIRVWDGEKLSDYVMDPGHCSHPATLQKWSDAQHGRVKEEDGEAVLEGRISVYHALLAEHAQLNEDMHKQPLIGPALDNVDVYRMWHAKSFPTLDQLGEQPQEPACRYHQETIDQECKQLATDMEIQARLMARAKRAGLPELPNCGPLALKAINSHREQMQPGEPSYVVSQLLQQLHGPRDGAMAGTGRI